MTHRPASFAAQLRSDLPLPAVKHVLDVFSGETVNLVSTLSDAASAGDAEMFRRIAHSILGSAATVGAVDLEQGARRGIACAKSTPEQIVEAAAQIDALSRAACSYAAEMIAEIG